MQRGATQKYRFNFYEGYVEDISDVIITFLQSNIVLDFKNDVLEFNNIDNYIEIRLSQNDTYKFTSGRLINIQIKFKDVETNVAFSKVFTEMVLPALNEEVL